MKLELITPRNDAGIVYIKDQKIHWDYNDNNLLEINISTIRAIGEYTTIHSFHRNEWFFVFALNNKENFQISAYATGMDNVLTELSSILNTELNYKLNLATDFQSNVIYPVQLWGKEFYELKIAESRTLFDRFRARLGFGSPIELIIRNEVMDYIK